MSDHPDLAGAVAARLTEQVEGLKSIETAAELSALIEAGRLPTRTPAAYVLPLGEDAEASATYANRLSQRVNETIGVVLVVNSRDRVAGSRALGDIQPLKASVQTALIGWKPEHFETAMQMDRSRMFDMSAGYLFYQLDFTSGRHIRVNNTN